MNPPRTVGLAIKAGLLGLLLIVCLGSEYLYRAALPWQFLDQVQAEVFATFQAADGQWLVVICISFYFVGFIGLNRSWNREGNLRRNDAVARGAHAARVLFSATRRKHRATTFSFTIRCARKWYDEVFGEPPNTTGQRPALPISNASFPLWRDAPVVLGLILYAIGALSYALCYEQSSRSTDTLVLGFGVTLLFGLRFWRAVEAQRSKPFNVAGVIFIFMLGLLSIAAVWRPESLQGFQYRGQVRWSGLWNNPNTFGMLMGVGLMLAVGMIVQGLMFKVQSLGKVSGRHLTPALSPNEAEREIGAVAIEHRTSNIQHRTFNTEVSTSWKC